MSITVFMGLDLGCTPPGWRRTVSVLTICAVWTLACGGTSARAPAPASPEPTPAAPDPLRLGERYHFDRDRGEVPNMDVSYVVVFHEDGGCRIADYEVTLHATYERSGSMLQVAGPSAAVGIGGLWDDDTLATNTESFPWTYRLSDDGRTLVLLGDENRPDIPHRLIADDDPGGGIELRELPRGKGKRKGGGGKAH